MLADITASGRAVAADAAPVADEQVSREERNAQWSHAACSNVAPTRSLRLRPGRRRK